jgi:hypothetical protein
MCPIHCRFSISRGRFRVMAIRNTCKSIHGAPTICVSRERVNDQTRISRPWRHGARPNDRCTGRQRDTCCPLFDPSPYCRPYVGLPYLDAGPRPRRCSGLRCSVRVEDRTRRGVVGRARL